MPLSPLNAPEVRLTSSLRGLLEAAFCERFDGALGADAGEILALARRFEVSGRIASRMRGARVAGIELAGQVPRRRIASDGGIANAPEFEHEWQADLEANLAVEAMLGRAQAQVEDVAARLSVPLVALKHAALKAVGAVAAGSRVVQDVDLLVRRSDAEPLWRALREAGFVRTGTRRHEHQLEALADPYGAVVELHVRMPGVQVPGARAPGRSRHGVTAEELRQWRLALPAPESSQRPLRRAPATALTVPTLPVLAAHALTHGLAKIRSTPQSYSLLRMLGDLINLRALQADVLLAARPYLTPELALLSEDAERLCVALTTPGALTASAFAGTREQRLLWHCLAARLHDEYARGLRATGLAEKWRAGATPRELASYIAGALFPTEHELDAIYGPATSRLERIRRRGLRPLDLAVRAGRTFIRPR